MRPWHRRLPDASARTCAPPGDTRGMTQAQLGASAGVTQSVIASIEAGAGGRIETLESICSALGGELALDLRLPYAGDGPRQVDRAHARCVGCMRRLLERAGHVCVTEQLIVDGPWRGWIDLVAYDAVRRRIVIAEVKTELRDAGALERQVERYVRSSLVVARERGWVVEEIVVVVMVLATAVNDAFLVANRHVLKGCVPRAWSRRRCRPARPGAGPGTIARHDRSSASRPTRGLSFGCRWPADGGAIPRPIARSRRRSDSRPCASPGRARRGAEPGTCDRISP